MSTTLMKEWKAKYRQAEKSMKHLHLDPTEDRQLYFSSCWQGKVWAKWFGHLCSHVQLAWAMLQNLREAVYLCKGFLKTLEPNTHPAKTMTALPHQLSLLLDICKWRLALEICVHKLTRYLFPAATLIHKIWLNNEYYCFFGIRSSLKWAGNLNPNLKDKSDDKYFGYCQQILRKN